MASVEAEVISYAEYMATAPKTKKRLQEDKIFDRKYLSYSMLILEIHTVGLR